MLFSQELRLYRLCESVPFNVLLTQSGYGTIKDEADVYLKSYLQEIDRNDVELVSNLFKMCQNKNIYRLQEPESPVGYEQH